MKTLPAILLLVLFASCRSAYTPKPFHIEGEYKTIENGNLSKLTIYSDSTFIYTEGLAAEYMPTCGGEWHYLGGKYFFLKGAKLSVLDYIGCCILFYPREWFAEIVSSNEIKINNKILKKYSEK